MEREVILDLLVRQESKVYPEQPVKREQRETQVLQEFPVKMVLQVYVDSQEREGFLELRVPQA